VDSTLQIVLLNFDVVLKGGGSR